MKNTGNLKVAPSGDLDIVMTRIFDAPRDLVYDAFAKPELLKLWFGPHGWWLTECTVDHRVGGGFRFLLTGPNGRTMGMGGRYLELTPPARSVHMESMDGFPGETRVTTVFDEADGKTTMTVTVNAPSSEIRDAILKSGMEHGAAESYDRLAALLAGTTATVA